MNEKEQTGQLTPFRVLALDGGGMGGLYTVTLLHGLVRRFIRDAAIAENPDLGYQFNLICGTSTGSILGAGLAAGIPLSTIKDLYLEQGPNIFPHPMPTASHGVGSRFWWAFRHAGASPSGNQPALEKALKTALGGETLGEMYVRRGIAFCAPSVWARTSAPRVFKTSHIPGKHMDDQQTLVEVCLASSAAPIFLPVHEHPNRGMDSRLEQYVDGGLWANNPVLVALTEATQMVKPGTPIEILSVGTPMIPSAKKAGNLDRGMKDWMAGIEILKMSMRSQAQGHAFVASFIAKAFESANWPIRIFRLKEDCIEKRTSDLVEHIELDASGQKAQEKMVEIGGDDAIYNYSELKKSTDPGVKWVSEVFIDLRALPVDAD